jgi:hypothetical protein
MHDQGAYSFPGFAFVALPYRPVVTIGSPRRLGVVQFSITGHDTSKQNTMTVLSRLGRALGV